MPIVMRITPETRPVKRTVARMVMLAMANRHNANGYSHLKLTLIATMYNALTYEAEYVRVKDRIQKVREA